MYIITKLNPGSHVIIDKIPANSRGAEIGVWLAGTSKRIIAKGVAELHLVDAYSAEVYLNSTEYAEGKWFEAFSTNVKSEKPTIEMVELYYDMIYNQVKKEMSKHEHVTLHRMASIEFFKNNKGLDLDWIYIDGDHSYEGCLQDLRNCLNVIKPGATIFGDDYGEHKPGVIKAVHEFEQETGYKLILLDEYQYMFET